VDWIGLAQDRDKWRASAEDGHKTETCSGY
jgi:hypothetical protein